MINIHKTESGRVVKRGNKGRNRGNEREEMLRGRGKEESEERRRTKIFYEILHACD